MRRNVAQPVPRLGSARLWKEIALSIGAVLGVLCIVLAVASTAFDVRPLVFRSGSMAPAIDTGALAISRTVATADLKNGDIVSVKDAEGVRVTHRIVAIKKQGSSATLTLKGDDNAVADAEPYVVSSVERVLFDIPRAGYVVSWLSGPIGLVLLGIYLAFVAGVIFSRGGGSGKSRPGAHRATAGAAALALVVGAGAGAGGAESTWAAWSDSATASSGTFKAHYVLPPDAMSCTNGSSVLLGYYNGVTFGITHKNVLYDYELRVYNGSGTQQGSAIAVPSGAAAAGATISSTVSASTLAELLQLGSPVYVRVYSKLKAAASWTSATYRQWRVDTGLLGLLLLNGVKCGADATTGDVTGPVIGFTTPTNGVNTTTTAFRETVRTSCGTNRPGCGMVSDASGIASITYQLKRVGNTLGTRYFHASSGIGGIWNTDDTFEEAQLSGGTWSFDGLVSTAYISDGAFTLTVKATDNRGNVTTSVITFTLT